MNHRRPRLRGHKSSGKSVLLRGLRADLGEEAIDLNEIAVDTEKPLIETVGATVEEGLELLSKVGLNDAFLFLRSYSQLSDGQRYWYRIAKMIETGKRWVLADEFCACSPYPNQQWSNIHELDHGELETVCV